MKRKSNHFKNRVFLCICFGISAFALSLALVKSRQDIILVGRKIGELEKSLSNYATKNAELDAKILRLSASESLRSVIAESGLVAMDKRNTVRVSNEEVHYFAMNNGNRGTINGLASENFSKQTNLTVTNQ
jgi:cell division protein FtsL